MQYNWPFHGLIPGSAAVVYADPPWPYENYSRLGEGRGAARHYATMSMDDIAALPVADLAAEDSALFMWVTKTRLPDALDLMRAWGFTYKTVAFTWVKTRPTGAEVMGNGFWTRANPEMVFLGTRGRPQRQSRGVRELVEEPAHWFEDGPDAVYAHIRQHSRKPDEVRDRIDALMQPGPPGADAKVELFARTAAPGWLAWGNQTSLFGAGSDLPSSLFNESHNGR